VGIIGSYNDGDSGVSFWIDLNKPKETNIIDGVGAVYGMEKHEGRYFLYKYLSSECYDVPVYYDFDIQTKTIGDSYILNRNCTSGNRSKLVNIDVANKKFVLIEERADESWNYFISKVKTISLDKDKTESTLIDASRIPQKLDMSEYDSSGNQLIMGNKGGDIYEFELESGKLNRLRKSDEGGLPGIFFGLDREYLCFRDDGGKAATYNLTSGMIQHGQFGSCVDANTDVWITEMVSKLRLPNDITYKLTKE
jgi:hypothetical protein